jgi:hypothetical protein
MNHRDTEAQRKKCKKNKSREELTQNSAGWSRQFSLWVVTLSVGGVHVETNHHGRLANCMRDRWRERGNSNACHVRIEPWSDRGVGERRIGWNGTGARFLVAWGLDNLGPVDPQRSFYRGVFLEAALSFCTRCSDRNKFFFSVSLCLCG